MLSLERQIKRDLAVENVCVFGGRGGGRIRERELLAAIHNYTVVVVMVGGRYKN